MVIYVLSPQRVWDISHHQITDSLSLLSDHPFDFDVAYLLASGVRVLVYTGKLDYVCNYYGTRAWTSAMQWPGQRSFNSADYAPWIMNGTLVGMCVFACMRPLCLSAFVLSMVVIY